MIARAEIRPVRVSSKTVWRHVVLTTDGGLAGVGEFTIGGGADSLDVTARRLVSPLVGQALDRLTGPVLAARWGGDFEAWAIASAVDQAVCDLAARQQGVPLAQHLAPTASLAPVPIYANINRRTDPRTPAGFAKSARAALAAGNTAIKLAPFDDVTPALCAAGSAEALIAAGLDRVRAVAAVGAGRADVMVDCHWRFTTERAAALIDSLAEIGVIWFECPIPERPAAVAELRRLRSRCATKGMRMAGCEKMTGLADFRPFIDGEAYDVIMPDVKYAGGLGETLRIAEALEAKGIGCSIHNPSGPVAHLMSVHAAAAIGGAERLETQFDESPLFGALTDPAPDFQDGTAVLPAASGLGVTLLA